MEEYVTNWSREELKIYLLMYCASADFDESKYETEYIKSKTSEKNFQKIYREFCSDNDFQSIQKIQTSIDNFGYTKKEIESLFVEMKELFLTDGKYDILEQNLYRGLNRILS